MTQSDYCSPWWPGDLGRLSIEKLAQRRDLVGQYVLDALRRCDPSPVEQGTVGGGVAELLELRGATADRRDLRDAWNAWLETNEEITQRHLGGAACDAPSDATAGATHQRCVTQPRNSIAQSAAQPTTQRVTQTAARR